MIAILLSEENASIIAASTTAPYFLTEEEVIAKVDIPNRINPGEKIYFIPSFDTHGIRGWATIPEQNFLENYHADMTKIDTEFVQITQK
jgi:hypothetical protein